MIFFVRHLMASSHLEIWSVSTYQAKGKEFKPSFHTFPSYDLYISSLFMPEGEKSYFTSPNKLKSFKNCHSFQNCEIFTCPKNWHSFCCRFFVLVKNFSRLPKSRLAILVRELQFVTLYRTMPASEVSFTKCLAS